MRAVSRFARASFTFQKVCNPSKIFPLAGNAEEPAIHRVVEDCWKPVSCGVHNLHSRSVAWLVASQRDFDLLFLDQDSQPLHLQKWPPLDGQLDRVSQSHRPFVNLEFSGRIKKWAFPADRDQGQSVFERVITEMT